MSKLFAFTMAVAFVLGGTIGAVVLRVGHSADDSTAALSNPRPGWTELQWPFPLDQWGKGKAYRCKPADCGTEVNLYLRAKIGFCNCVNGMADDAELDRMTDLDLVGGKRSGGEVSPLGPGRPITVGHMKGRSRSYALTTGGPPGNTAIAVAFNDRCDMVVATALLPRDRLAAIEPHVIAFLNSEAVLRWSEVALGL